ncbi:MAG: hypothetical protein K2X99_05110, partial [Gemmatimonadaceae bacterium]|nr:hypothetical protein [Gemmatimonadaceae bacterium]
MVGRTYDGVVVTAPGLEAITLAELRALGIAATVEDAGTIGGAMTLAQVAMANIALRTASRVVVRVATFAAPGFRELEKGAKTLDWSRFAPRGGAVAFRVTCRKSRLYHSDAVAQRLGNALLARVPDARVVKWSDEEDDQVQRFVVRLMRDECTVSADSSGTLLHRRGYRLESGKAPLRETLAAAMLLASGWDAASPLIDPMCGSGTLAIEGAMLARGIAPGSGRAFAGERWPSGDAAVWREARATARAAERAINFPILASARDAGAMAAASANAERAGVLDTLTLATQPYSAL